MRRLPRPASWWGRRFACQPGPLRLVNKQPCHLAWLARPFRDGPLRRPYRLILLNDTRGQPRKILLGHATAAGGPFRARIGRSEGEAGMVWSAGTWIPFDAGVRVRWRMTA